MKRITVIATAFLLISLFLIGCATPAATLEQESSLERVVEFSGMSQDEIYQSAEDWIARSFRSANDVVQLRDPENGRLVGQGTGSEVIAFYNRYFDYTMIIDIREGRMRVQYENVRSRTVGGVVGPDMNSNWRQVEAYMNGLTDSLIAAIEGNTVEDDW